MGTAQLAFAEVERGEATGSDVTGSGPGRAPKWSRDPEGCFLGCTHPQPEVGFCRRFFGCFRICCVVLHVRVPRHVLEKRCISNVAVWKSTGKKYAKMKCLITSYTRTLETITFALHFCYIFRDFDVSWFLPLIFVFIQHLNHYFVDLLQFCHRCLR
jgi:hypothetical protein